MRFSFSPIFLLGLWLTSLAFATPQNSQKKSSVSAILKPYFQLQKTLSQDKLDSVKDLSDSMKVVVEKLATQNLTENEHKLLQATLQEVVKLSQSQEPKDYRIQFGNLSKTLVEFLKTRTKEAANYQLFFCPMFPQGYAFWIQPQGESLANPYWGKEMLTCGVKRPW